jgi:quinol monooxygenase YgiN
MASKLGPMLAIAGALAVASPYAQAQSAGGQAAYVVTYIEVEPGAQSEVPPLLKQLADASRKESGNLRFEVLQRTDRRHHFAILEAWKDQKAAETHAAAPTTKQFRDRLQPLLSAPFDERPHTGLAVGAIEAAGGRRALYAVTHVDIIPPKKDDGIADLKTLAAAASKEPGVLRYEVLQQNSRPNHFTVTEIWKSRKGLDAHLTTASTKSFRDKLLPMSGSLYDERLYRKID